MQYQKTILAMIFLFSTQAFAQASDLPPTKGTSANPDLSVNALMLYGNSNRGTDTNNVSDASSPVVNPNGIRIQEAEMQFYADVDPYSRLTALLSVHQNTYNPNDDWVIEPEELFAETLQIPGVTLRAGKFKSAFGKHNGLHTHAFPFIDAPMINTVFLGGDGLNDIGVSGAILLPLSWYSELTVQVLSGHSPDVKNYFNAKQADKEVLLDHFKNLWDLNDDLTMEVGFSGASGRNSFNARTTILGADLTFKWRPMMGGKYHAWIWATEYMTRHVNESAAPNSSGLGYATWLQYQFAQRWWVQARTEYLQDANDNTNIGKDANNNPITIAIQPHQRKYSALVGFFPSEFSGVRLQYSYLADQMPGMDAEQRLDLQLNFTIGAHPAHSY